MFTDISDKRAASIFRAEEWTLPFTKLKMEAVNCSETPALHPKRQQFLSNNVLGISAGWDLLKNVLSDGLSYW
jgi:hypothetical protein